MGTRQLIESRLKFRGRIPLLKRGRNRFPRRFRRLRAHRLVVPAGLFHRSRTRGFAVSAICQIVHLRPKSFQNYSSKPRSVKKVRFSRSGDAFALSSRISVVRLRLRPRNRYVNRALRSKPEMPGSIHRDRRSCTGWYVVVLLLSIFSLTLQLATRFTLRTASVSTSGKSLHKQSSRNVDPRLTRDSVNWFPPAVSSTIYRSSSVVLLTVASGPETPNRPAKSSLFTRPPPYSYFL